MRHLRNVRDVVVIFAAVAVLYGVVTFDVARRDRERELLARRVHVTKLVSALEQAYKTAVFNDSENKGIHHQIFRQNEILLEYQKLLLTRDLMPVEVLQMDALPPPPRLLPPR